MAGFRVLLDTCVLVPIVKTDLLLTLARRHAFHPLWSDAILDELSRTIVLVNPNISGDRAAERIQNMNDAFEDALVRDWEPLEACITGLPDPDDRHVVAAAIRGNAAAIVTDNIKHFPDAALAPWGIHAVGSDDFLVDSLDLSKSRMLACLIEMAEKRTNPKLTVDNIVEALERAGAARFVREIRSLLDDD